MSRLRTVLLLSVSLLLVLGMLWGHGVFSTRGSATAASASNLSCTGPQTGTFNNVVVPESASCTLSSAMV